MEVQEAEEVETVEAEEAVQEDEDDEDVEGMPEDEMPEDEEDVPFEEARDVDMGSGMIVNSIKKSLVMPNSWNPIKICQTDGQEFNPYILPFFLDHLFEEWTHGITPGSTWYNASWKIQGHSDTWKSNGLIIMFPTWSPLKVTTLW